MSDEPLAAFVYPLSPDWNVGSQRIYSLAVIDILQERGHLTKSLSEAKVIYVGRGFLRQFFREATVGVDQIIVSMNPSSELAWLEKKTLNRIDHFIVGSFEEQSSLSKYASKTHVLPQIEEWIEQDLYLEERSKAPCFNIMYHGNREHLDEISEEAKKAIHRFATQVPTRFVLVYDVEKTGRASLRIPGVEVEHVQWSREAMRKNLLEAHVGIVPALTAWSVRPPSFLKWAMNKLRLGSRLDTVLKMKRTSNIGRALVFAQARVPIIAEPTPSNASLIPTPKFGELVLTEKDWYRALTRFADSDERESVARHSFSLIKEIGLSFPEMFMSVHQEIGAR